jgi:hypothetical protein
MSLRCRLCGFSDFRTARLRGADSLRLLILQYPVRCRNCRERAYAFVLRVGKMKRDAESRHSKNMDTPHART